MDTRGSLFTCHQLELRVDGEPVTSITNGKWSELLNELFGISPLVEEIRDFRLKLTWIEEYFGNVVEHAITYNNVANTIRDRLYWPIYIKELCLANNIDHKEICGTYLLIQRNIRQATKDTGELIMAFMTSLQKTKKILIVVSYMRYLLINGRSDTNLFIAISLQTIYT
ncbi:hypothetical protein CR513_09202, partial [Mucuna pruriens]